MLAGLPRLSQYAEVRQHGRQLHLFPHDELRHGLHVQLPKGQLRRYIGREECVLFWETQSAVKWESGANDATSFNRALTGCQGKLFFLLKPKFDFD